MVISLNKEACVGLIVNLPGDFQRTDTANIPVKAVALSMVSSGRAGSPHAVQAAQAHM